MSPTPAARTLGAVVQGVILGALLLLAILELASAHLGGQVFKYQGF